MTKHEFKTGIQKAVNLHEVPPERFSVMLKKTVVGAGFVAMGVAGMAKFGFPWYAGLGCVVVGATTWSGQIVTGALKALIGPLKQIVGAAKNGD